MPSILDHYTAVYSQGFVPIFTADAFDAVVLAEASVRAGAAAIEITCRRANVCEEIRRIRAAFPDLCILAGSVVDDGPMLRFLKRKRPDMPSMDELADLGVNGFVSAMPISLETIARLHQTHLLVPGIETVTQAVQAVEAGAHFAKVFTATLGGEEARIALMTSAPLHQLIPIFVTGGVTRQKIESYVKAGAALLGAGWELILGARRDALLRTQDVDQISTHLQEYLGAMTQVRRSHHPELLDDRGAVRVNAIRHFHPF